MNNGVKMNIQPLIKTYKQFIHDDFSSYLLFFNAGL